MKTTALGALVSGTGWLAILVGFVQGSLAPATLGVFLVAGLEAARWNVRRVRVRITRDAPTRLQVGEKTTVVTRADADSAAPLWVRSRIDLPLGIVREDHRVARGSAEHAAVVQAVEAGTVTWKSAEVRVADPWGLHEDVQRVPAPGRLQVSPEDDWVQVGRRIGRKRTVQALTKARKMSEPVPELATIRQFHPGDRLRDIDWARSSRMQALHSRVRDRAASRPIVVLLDATTTMRYHRGRAKITTAARIAYGVAAAAQAAGVTGEILAFDENGVSRLAGRGGMTEALRRLGQLDSPIPVQDIPTFAAQQTTRDERGFLGALSLLTHGHAPPLPPLNAAVAALRRSPDRSLVVAILDGESDPNRTERAVRRICKGGQDVILVLPASGAHHVRRHEAAAWADRLEAWELARGDLSHGLLSLRVPVIVAGPHDVDRVIQEVATRAK